MTSSDPRRAGEPDRFDFRTPNKFQSGFVRELTELHKTFSRALSERLSRELRVAVTVDQISAEQLTYEGYIRSMPNPNILSVLNLDPLPGQVVLEISPQLGLVLVDRMLGGPGRPIAPRPPTQLEQTILGVVLDHPLAAIQETFDGLLEVHPRFVTSELNPQFAHAAAPTETVLTMTFSLTAESSGPATRGLITVCYPITTLNPIREALREAKWNGSTVHVAGSDAVAAAVAAATVEVVLRTGSTKVRASDMVGLAPGDVVMLDHTLDEPLIGEVAGVATLECDLGHTGPFLAAQIRRWTT
jgi:flagellar motor switch protein FliM